MTTYISILRGINVSGHRAIKMDVLKAMYEELDFSAVHTYIQSGNVVFEYCNYAVNDLEQKISSKIKDSFGFDVPVIVLEKEKLKKIIAGNPFLEDNTRDISFLHITFLSSQPEKRDIESIGNVQSNEDEFVLSDQAIYLYCPNGYGRTKLTNTFFENRLKVAATTRNWKTSVELLNMAGN